MGARRRCANVLWALVFMCCSGVLANAQFSIGEFISIDCGNPTSYNDSLGISWSNDNAYIPVGVNAIVNTASADLGADKAQLNRTLSTLRYFPGGRKKYCYVIPEALENTVYLIRLMFLGGDFTASQNQITNFRINIDMYDWTDVTISDSYTPLTTEVKYSTLTGPLSICLVRGVGTPFISSLELRALPRLAYLGYFRSIAFTTVVRWNCGTSPTNASLRYPDDRYDRLWASDPPSLDFRSLSNYSSTLYNTSSTDGNSPPIKALQSAWTVPLNDTLEFVWQVPTGKLAFIAFLYFAEISSVPRNGFRTVLPYMDDTLFQPVNVNSTIAMVYNYTVTIGDTLTIRIDPGNGSTLGPILNAFEVFSAALLNDSYITWEADVNAVAAIQQNFNLTDWTGDPCLPFAWDWVECSSPNDTTISRILEINLSNYSLSGTIPEEITSLTDLQVLSLDHNNLTGDISVLGLLRNLQKLDLRNNSFQGSIPDSLSGTQDLTELYVDNNNLTGNVPQALLTKVQERTLTFSASGNPYLCVGGNETCNNSTSESSPPRDADPEGQNSSSTVAIAAGAAGGAVALIALVGIFFFCWKRRSSKNEIAFDPTGSTSAQKEHPVQGTAFSLDEVKAATNNFAKMIGKGGFGSVYYGKLSDGQEVAVKVNKGSVANGQGTAEFLNEVALLSRVHHRNLVSLLGYCDELDQQILIYSYMSEGTVQQHLYGETQIGIQLDWKARLDIALNAARGLEYLHNSCSPPIIHRDIKSSNILLTHELLAKVADFGISKITTDIDKTRGVTTMIKGTYGYLDPEYFMQHRLTTKSDVYSFGIVLLELVTGKKPSTTSFPGSTATHITGWVRESVREGNIHVIIDPQLGGSYNLESVWNVVEMALLSVDMDGVKRPGMQEIVKALTNALEFQTQYVSTSTTDPPHLSPGDFDQYQRVHHAPRDSNDSVAAYSWGSAGTNMSGR